MTTDELADALNDCAMVLRSLDSELPTASIASRCEQSATRLRELQAALDRLHGSKFSDRVYHALKSRAETAEAEVTRLREALQRYGDHTHDCPEHIANVMVGQGGNCTCGYEALAGLDATGEKR